MNSSAIGGKTIHSTSAVSPPSPQTAKDRACSQNGTSAGENGGGGIMYSELSVYNISNGKTIKWDWWRDEDNWAGVGEGGGGVAAGGGGVGSDCLSIPVCVPPGGTNVSFEQFVDSPLSSWPAPIQTGSIFWTLGMPRMSRGHQCVIQMPWLHCHHILRCACISGLASRTRAYLQWKQCSHFYQFVDDDKWSFFTHISSHLWDTLTYLS